jgi:hypothetical protein
LLNGPRTQAAVGFRHGTEIFLKELEKVSQDAAAHESTLSSRCHVRGRHLPDMFMHWIASIEREAPKNGLVAKASLQETTFKK